MSSPKKPKNGSVRLPVNPPINLSVDSHADGTGYLSVAEVSLLLDRARERCGGLDALREEILRVTGEKVTFQHLSRMIRSGSKHGRDPQGPALEYMGLERCVLYRKIKGTKE